MLLGDGEKLLGNGVSGRGRRAARSEHGSKHTVQTLECRPKPLSQASHLHIVAGHQQDDLSGTGQPGIRQGLCEKRPADPPALHILGNRDPDLDIEIAELISIKKTDDPPAIENGKPHDRIAFRDPARHDFWLDPRQETRNQTFTVQIGKVLSEKPFAEMLSAQILDRIMFHTE